MALDPLTLGLIIGGAALLARRKKKSNGKTTNGNGKTNGNGGAPPECPAGFAWSEADRMCVPAGEGPPQIHVTGLCEYWTMLPSPQVWFDQYAGPAIAEVVAAIKAAPSGDASPVLQGNENLGSDVIAHMLLANSPVAYATPEFPDLGRLCKLPYSESLGPDPEPGAPVPEAMAGLFAYTQSVVEQAVMAFNQTGVITIPEIEQ